MSPRRWSEWAVEVSPSGEEMTLAQATRDMADFGSRKPTAEQQADIRAAFVDAFGPDIFTPPGYRRKATS